MLIIKERLCDCCRKHMKYTRYYLTWIKNESWCKTCGQCKQEEVRFEFCSAKCLAHHSNLLLAHKHQWGIGTFGGGAQIKKNKIIKVHVYCEICKEQRWISPNPILRKKYQQYFRSNEEFAKALKDKGV